MKTFRNAVWLYLGSDVKNAEEIDAFAAWCIRNRVGIVLVHLKLAGGHSVEIKERVERLIETCARNGIEVHGMISALLARTTDRNTLLFQDSEYYCVDAHGISNWVEPICGRGFVYDPLHPEVVKAVSEGSAQLLKEFPGLSGIHLDFIRYYHYESKLIIDTKSAGHWIAMPKVGHPIRFEMADGSKTTYFVEEVRNTYNDPPVGDKVTLARFYRYCFCESCLSEFERRSGISLPSSLTATAEKAAWLLQRHPAEWAKFRASVITSLVGTIREAVCAARADAKLSAAVWYNAPYGNELRGEPFTPDSEYDCFGQEWWEWAKAGYLDFVCPMDYWMGPDSFGRIVEDQMHKANGNVPVYAGILRTPEYDIDEERFAEYREKVASAGADGICFFHYGSWKQLLS
jgi:hypothetical protein